VTQADAPYLTILMPCLNEARTLETCVRKAQAFLAEQTYSGEIVVADNGSTDGSRDIAASLGARVVAVPARGYGNALQAGIDAARGELVIMGDSDDSYDFRRLDGFVARLADGFDLVVGNRFRGGIAKGAMPPLHRYVGNPLLTRLGRTIFNAPINDFYCGLRGFRRDAIRRLKLNSAGMEFALEMVVKATLHGLRIAEVPTTLSPDGRGRPPHLRSWRDGWRSLRFYLLLSPRWLFLYPGLAMFTAAGLLSLVLIATDIRVGAVVFSFHTLILSATMTLIGVQSVVFWVLSHSVALQKGLLLPDAAFRAIRPLFSLERCLAVGVALVAVGFAAALYALFHWSRRSFGPLATPEIVKTICAASLAVALGFELIFSSFFIYLLDQPNDRAP